MDTSALDVIAVFIQQQNPNTGTVISVPDNLVTIVIGASGAALIAATFGKTAVDILKSAGKNVPLWFDARSQGKQIEVGTLGQMEQIVRGLGTLVANLQTDLNSQRTIMMSQGQQHDEEIRNLRRDLDIMTQQHNDQEILLSGAALKIRNLEAEKEEWRVKAEDYRLRYEGEVVTRQSLEEELKLYRTGDMPAITEVIENIEEKGSSSEEVVISPVPVADDVVSDAASSSGSNAGA